MQTSWVIVCVREGINSFLSLSILSPSKVLRGSLSLLFCHSRTFIPLPIILFILSSFFYSSSKSRLYVDGAIAASSTTRFITRVAWSISVSIGSTERVRELTLSRTGLLHFYSCRIVARAIGEASEQDGKFSVCKSLPHSFSSPWTMVNRQSLSL